MYRQVLVDSRDVDYQRILWRSKATDPISEYKLLTVTYGTACTPYLALCVLQQVAHDEGAKFPLAVPILRQHIYVDDCVFGADDMPLAHRTREQVTALLQTAGFQLCKWASNNSALLEGIDPQDHGLAMSKSLKTNEQIKILGIKWHPHTDAFHFDVTLEKSAPETKRSMLSSIARIFDPFEWIAPIVITAKRIMQQFWLLCCKWDDVIPDSLLNQWRDYYAQLALLHQVSVSRWTGHGSDTLVAEVHGFADASTSAYGVVIYLKVTRFDNSVTVTMLTAKSKVTPFKPMSIPRLELCAALLLSRTMTFIRSALDLSGLPCHCWTDSTVTLAWIKQSPSRWKTFIANRVHEVQTLQPDAIWRHVPSQQNPADLASRGVMPADLINQPLWWQGPEWLKLSPDQWPATQLVDSIELPPDERARLHVHNANVHDQWDLMNRFSSWMKLLRVTAYIIRFAERLRKHHEPSAYDGALTPNQQSASIVLLPEEVKSARNFWLKTIQQELFPNEYCDLQHSRRISNRSKILSLNPFMDKKGLIRVGGRLRHSDLTPEVKNPILLASHPLVNALIRDTHLNALHSGPHLTLYLLRQNFWILRARQTIRSTLYRCMKCAREIAAVPHELMSDLPACRVRSTTRPFQHCGVDYAGPIQVRLNPGRGHKARKAYIAVFVCMTVKALHLKLVSDCTTPAFIAAFERFCARRGVPGDMYSDNATNFHGAQRELSVAWSNATSDSNFLNNAASRGVHWHFIPLSAPHFGGLWEACVRSVKFHLKRVIGAHTLTFEEMSTLLCKIESCLNSRPIAQMSDNYDDYSALTPNHFLVGSALASVAEPSLLEEKETRLTRWQLLCQMRDGFWKVWSNEYLHTLQQCPKWREIQNLARVGRLVLLRNPIAPPCNWELGRVVECHPGDNGLTRVVTERTARSTFRRALVKFSFLPVDLNSDSQSNLKPE